MDRKLKSGAVTTDMGLSANRRGVASVARVDSNSDLILGAVLLLLTCVPLPVMTAPLDFEHAAVAAMGMSPSFDYTSHAEDYLRLFRPRVWQAANASAEQTQEALRAAVVEMKARASRAKAADPLVFEQRLLLGEYDPVVGHFPVQAPFARGYFAVTMDNSGQYPNGYVFILANPNIVRGLPMEPAEVAAFERDRKRLTRRERSRLHGRFHIQPVKFLHGFQILAVITRAELLSDRQHARPVAEIRESADPGQLVAARLLSEGVTLDFQEEHSFSFRGARIHEWLAEGNPALGECRDVGREHAHRVVTCEGDVRLGNGSATFVRRYVGGLLVEGRLIRGNRLSSAARFDVERRLGRWGYRGPENPKAVVEWTRGKGGFRFDPAAMSPGSEQKTFIIVWSLPYKQWQSERDANGSSGAPQRGG